MHNNATVIHFVIRRPHWSKRCVYIKSFGSLPEISVACLDTTPYCVHFVIRNYIIQCHDYALSLTLASVISRFSSNFYSNCNVHPLANAWPRIDTHRLITAFSKNKR